MKKKLFYKENKSLKATFIVLILPIVTFITIILFFLIEMTNVSSNEIFLLDKLNHQLDTHSLILAYPMWNVDAERIGSIMDLLILDPDIAGISIFDENDMLFSSKGNIENFAKSDLDLWLQQNPDSKMNLSGFFKHIFMALGFSGKKAEYYTDSRTLSFETDGQIQTIGSLYLVLSDANININYHKHLIYTLVLCFTILIAISVSITFSYQVIIDSPLKKLKRSIQKARKEQGENITDEYNNKLNELDYVNVIFEKLWKSKKTLEEELIASKDMFEISIKKAPVPMVIINSDQSILHFNDMFIETFGYNTSDISTAEEWWNRAFPDKNYRRKIQLKWQNSIESSERNNSEIGVLESDITIKDHSVRRVELKITTLGDTSIIAMNDITRRKQSEREKMALQDQLNHRSKMDAIGQLAGGMSHDFNNVLSGIMSAAQLLQLPQRNLDEKSLKYVDMILKASLRATDLIGKLLMFGRKGSLAMTTLDLHTIVDDTVEILNRTIDKKITITTIKKATRTTVIGDHSSLENALLNLGINASHAMEDGGVIQISSENIFLDKPYCQFNPFELTPGEYCKIGISDTGAGISPVNLDKIFEPFFTTKGQGKGTGLGLASVYGTIQEHHGEIRVISDVGEGSSFFLILPCSEKTVKATGTSDQILSGKGTILLVDDEEFNRNIGKDVLNSLGYNVILAENGEESVEIFKTRNWEIDLVLMDMIMPVMNGSEAFLMMKEIDNNCKVIISSGFTRDENIDDLKEKGLIGFIHKPYRISELSQLLNKNLGGE